MRFSFWPSPTQPWSEVLHLAQHVERKSYHGIWYADHFMPNDGDVSAPWNESWSMIAALAAAVPRLRIGPLVAGNTYRHPAVLAKMAATVDQISNGRVVLGLGGGWQENEHRAYGMDFYTTAERLKRLDEACRVMKALWTEAKASYKGAFYQLEDAPLMPKPVQKPYPELMIGGGGEKVTLRIAAQHADHWNVWGGPETLTHKGRILDAHCVKVGRDPKRILRSAVMVLGFADDRAGVERVQQAYMKRMGADETKARDTVLAGSASEIRDKLSKLQAAGVGMLFIPTFLLPADRLRALDRFMAEVAPAFR